MHIQLLNNTFVSTNREQLSATKSGVVDVAMMLKLSTRNFLCTTRKNDIRVKMKYIPTHDHIAILLYSLGLYVMHLRKRVYLREYLSLVYWSI